MPWGGSEGCGQAVQCLLCSSPFLMLFPAPGWVLPLPSGAFPTWLQALIQALIQLGVLWAAAAARPPASGWANPHRAAAALGHSHPLCVAPTGCRVHLLQCTEHLLPLADTGAAGDASHFLIPLPSCCAVLQPFPNAHSSAALLTPSWMEVQHPAPKPSAVLWV